METTYIFAGKHRQVSLDHTSQGSGHPFGADYRTSIRLKLTDFSFELLHLPVMVESDHIRGRELEFIQGLIIEPESDGQWLRGINVACPIKDGLDQR